MTEMRTNLTATLEELRFGGIRNPTDAGWTRLANGLPNLRKVNVVNTQIGDDGLMAFASTATQLQEFKAGKTHVTCSGLAAFEGHEHIALIDLYRIASPCTDEHIDMLLKIKPLKILKVQGANTFSDEGRERLVDAGVRIID